MNMTIFLLYLIWTRQSQAAIPPSLNDAIKAGVPASSIKSLSPDFQSMTIVGDTDERVRVQGPSGLDSRCSLADESLNYELERYGYLTVCNCSAIYYSNKVTGEVRNPSDGFNQVDPSRATGGVNYTTSAGVATIVLTTLTFIEAGVCVPKPCCPERYFRPKVAAVPLDINGLYGPYVGGVVVGVSGTNRTINPGPLPKEILDWDVVLLNRQQRPVAGLIAE